MESDQEGVEDLIGREHLNIDTGIMEGGVKDERWEDKTSLLFFIKVKDFHIFITLYLVTTQTTANMTNTASQLLL